MTRSTSLIRQDRDAKGEANVEVKRNILNNRKMTFVAVMGLTGAGKSTFVKALTGADVSIGHGLKSHTSTLGFFEYKSDDGQTIILIDTPGFDDTYRNEVDILQSCALYFSSIYKQKFDFGGIIQVHDITSARFSGSAMKNIKMLRELCGENAFRRVVFVTTKWGSINESDREKAEAREKELAEEPNFWGLMCKRGSRVMRFDDTKESARDIVSKLLNAGDQKVALNIQHEMIDQHLRLVDTGAGKIVKKTIAERIMVDDLDRERLRSDLQSSIEAEDKELVAYHKQAIAGSEAVKIKNETDLEKLLQNFEEIRYSQRSAFQRAQESEDSSFFGRLWGRFLLVCQGFLIIGPVLIIASLLEVRGFF